MRKTDDAVFGGRVVLGQPARGDGYRVNADALILADFAGRARGTVVDLGAGTGAVALVMVARAFASRAVLVDVDDAACTLARENVERNGARADVLCGDALEIARTRRGTAGVVVCNPPYFEPGTARVARGSGVSRVGEVDRFVRAAREVLGRGGRACFVYPATNLARLLSCFRAAGLEPKRLRFVHATASAPARVALVEVRASKSGGLAIAPPLVERDGPGHADYTAEMRSILGLTSS